MYGDILRSYSAATIGPASNSVNAFNGGWPHRTSSREPLRLKLSILSDQNPTTRSILNGGAPARSYSSMWSAQPDADQMWTPGRRDYEKPARSRDDGVTLAVVGIKRTASNWRPSDYEDRFSSFNASPTSQRRGRIGSEPTATFARFPGDYSKTERTSANNTSIPSPFAGSRYSNGAERRDRLNENEHFAHDQQRGIGGGPPSKSRYGRDMDVDDALDEVFASIVRRALSDDAVSPTQTQTSPAAASAEEADNGERLRNVLRQRRNDSYESTGTKSKRLHSRHPDHLTQPFSVKRTISSSAVVDSRPPQHPRREKQHQAGAYFPASVENREKPFRQQLEKVSTDADAKNSAPVQLNDNQGDSPAAWSYQPYYYRSATAPATESRAEIENRPQRQAAIAVSHTVEPGRGASEREKEESSPKSNRYLQKSEPFLNRKRDSQEKVESFIDKGPKGDGSESLSGKKREQDERPAWGVTSYYAEDITALNNDNRRRLLGESGAGKLRTAKSESSLRMANKELLLSDKEIYQIEIMNSGLSAPRIYVCQCLANLYFDDGASSSTSNGDTSTMRQSDSPWRRIATGVPVLVLESEQPNTSNRTNKDSQQSRRLLIRLTELGNGFKLWEDVIDAYSGYTVDRTFHTMSTSADYRRRAGLSFDSHSAALKFHQHVREFSEELDSFAADGRDNAKRRHSKSIWAAFRRTSISDGPSSNGGYYGGARHPEFGPPSTRRNMSWTPAPGLALDSSGPVRKTDISLPCCFKHVTSLKPGDVLPSAVLVTTSACPSSVSSSTNTLTRVNRSATIKSVNSKSQSSTATDDGIGVLDSVGITRPKRAQSCTQILNDQPQKRVNNDESHQTPCRFMDNPNSSNGGPYLSNEPANGPFLVRRFGNSVEPVV